MSTPPTDTAHAEEAVNAWRRRAPVTDEEFAQLDEASKARAFRVAGVAQVELLADVWRALEAALARGDSFDDFKRAIGPKLTEAWGGEQPWRVETIFRTNLQVAYSAGRYKTLESPVLKRRRPFRKYSSILDSRTSPICAPLNGTVLPADDAFWASHQPPLHFNCRSAVIALTPAQAEAAGVAEEAPEGDDPQKGFGAPPDLSDWTPDLSNVPEPLATAYRRTQQP